MGRPIPLERPLDDNPAVAEIDPYQPPVAELQMPAQRGPGGEVLASRGSRFAAAILDSLIILVILLPIQWSMGVFDNPEANSLTTTVIWGAVGFVLYMMIQGYFLATRAQSIGKIASGIKIVTLDGRNADLTRIIGLRVVPIALLSMIPVVGNFVSLIDSLWIFREDQRCLHDHIAGTRVVRA